MIEIIIPLVFGIFAIFCLNLYESISTPMTYAQQMRWLGSGMTLVWQDDRTGIINQKKFVLSEMNSCERKNLEKDLISAGLNREAERVHEYRKFTVEKHLLQRSDQKERRVRMRNLAVKNGLDLSKMPLEKLDAFILDTFGRPLSIIGYE